MKAVLVIAWLAAAAWLAAPGAQAAADPFYLDLLRDGVQAYDRGEFAAAAKSLHLACFGMLDDPNELAGCLTRLALAESGAGNVEGFRDAFRRIAQAEDRFGGYSRADLPGEVRTAFEQRALAAIPAGTLESLPKFKELLNRQLEVQIASQPPKERRRLVEERLAKDPRSIIWNLALADLDLAEGKTAAALTRAEQVAKAAPQEPRALCLRGLARSQAGRCTEALADLEPCYLSGREVRYATALLGCRVELAQWGPAEEQVRTMPAGFKADRKVAALTQQVAKRQGGPAAAAPAAGGRTTAVKPSPAGGTVEAAGRLRTSPGLPPQPQPSAAPPPVTTTPGSGSLASSANPAKPPSPANPLSGAGGGTATPPAPPSTPANSASGATTATPRPLSAADRETMARCQRLLAANSSRDLKEGLRLARELADAHPDSKEALYLAGEAAYRNSRWVDAATYFRRAGQPSDDHPELLFYMAVALYQVGDQPGAASALRRSLPNLQKTPYVDDYLKRILGAKAAAPAPPGGPGAPGGRGE